MRHLELLLVAVLSVPVVLAACQQMPEYDFVIRGGSLYDGKGSAPVIGDLAITNDRIMAIGDLSRSLGRIEIDATGSAVAPGFINMLSHSYISILQDPRSLGELKQGVTTQIFGEGNFFLEIQNHGIEEEAAEDLLAAVDAAVAGTTLLELDEIGERVIADHGCTPSFLGYLGSYPATLCLSPNDVIVHGIPDGYRLQEGDLLSVDAGAIY